MAPSKKPLPDYARYSAMAFQMGLIIFASAWGGIELDKYVKRIDFPLFTIVFILFGVFAAVYLSIKDLIKKK